MNTMQLVCATTLTLANTFANAQVPPCTGYQGDFVYGSYLNDKVNKAIGTSDGNVVVVGLLSPAIGGNLSAVRYGDDDALVMKIAPDGTLLWNKVYGGSRWDEFRWVAQLPDGGFLVAGFTQSSDGTVTGPSIGLGGDGWYLRLDSDGNELWNRRVGGSSVTTDLVDGALTVDGAILINGGSGGQGVRIDLNGNVLLSSDLYNGTSITSALDGTFLIARRIVGPSTGLFAGEPAPIGPVEDIGLVNIDADATVNWVHRFIAPSSDECQSLLALPDGYVVLSYSYGAVGGDRVDPGDPVLGDFWLIRTDLAGDIVWERSMGSTHNDLVSNACFDTDGGILCMGSTERAADGDVTEGSRGIEDGWIFKVDALGNKLWDKRWGGGGADRIMDLIAVSSGYLLLCNSGSPRGGDHHQPNIHWYDLDIWMMQMFPGTPTHWYYDNDGDDLGENPFFPVDDCVQPDFYVDNNWDCNDLVPNPATEYLGAGCNDGNWLTINDALQPGCVCGGTYVLSDLTPVTFTLWPDYDPGQTTWELRDLSTQQIALQGGPYPNGQQGVPESSTVMIPPVDNQRFQLFVYDGQGNGMQGGRYTLTANGKRLIDSDGLFQQVSTVNSTLAPVDVPIGNIGLTQYTCDRLDLLSTSVIVASEDIEVSMRYDLRESDTGYQFWIYDPHGSYSRTIFKSHKNPGKGGAPGPTECAHLSLSSIVTNPVPQQRLLNVRVRTRINGVDGPFGPACTMKIDPYAAACPTTKLVDLPNDAHYSCNGTYPLNGTTRIWAHAKTGVNKYQFEFRDQQGPYVRTIASATASLLLSTWATSPLQPLHVYSVRVRCSLDNGQTWCAWGTACTIYTAGGGRSMEAQLSDADDAFLVYPNPVNSGEVYVQLMDPEAGVGVVDLMLMDVAGRSVLQTRMDATALGDEPVILPSSLLPGTYLLRLEHNGVIQHERLVVQ